MNDDPKSSSEKPVADRTGSSPKRDPKPTADRSGASAEKAGAAKKESGSKASSAGKPRTDPNTLRYLAIAAVSLVVGLLLGALIFGGDSDDDGGDTATSPLEAQTVTPEELAAEAASLGRPVYWAGPQEGAVIELERTAEGNTSVRYIPEGEDAEGAAGDYLTIVTYPYPNARKALEQQAAGSIFSRELPEGGFAISQPGQPTNAYLAYEDEDYQVEVYDPRPGRALKLVLDGSVVNAAG